MEFILPIINAFEKQIMKLIPRFYNLIIELVNKDDMQLGKYIKNNSDDNVLVHALVELYEKCDINKSNYLIQQLKTLDDKQIDAVIGIVNCIDEIKQDR